MRFVFNYPVTVATVTPDGNLCRLRFACGSTVTAREYPMRNLADRQEVLNFELTDGHQLINVPVGAVRLEGCASALV